jgi:hypothetical protein
MEVKKTNAITVRATNKIRLGIKANLPIQRVSLRGARGKAATSQDRIGAIKSADDSTAVSSFVLLPEFLDFG